MKSVSLRMGQVLIMGTLVLFLAIPVFSENVGNVMLLPSLQADAQGCHLPSLENTSWSDEHTSPRLRLVRLVQCNQLAAATELFNKAFQTDQNLQLIYSVVLGNAYYQAGLLNQALQFWQVAPEMAADTLVINGQKARLTDHTDEAEQKFRLALKLVPDKATAYRELGYLYWNRFQWKEAQNAFQSYLRLSSEQPADGLYYLARIAIENEGDEITANDLVNRLEQIYPDNSYTLAGIILLGNARRQLQDYRNAEKYYQLAKERFPNNEEPLMYLGINALEQEHFVDAERYLIQALQKNDGNAEIYYYLGNLYLDQGKLFDARAILEKAIDLNSNKSLYYTSLATVYLKLNEPCQAINALKAYLKLEPDDQKTDLKLKSIGNCNR